MDAVRERKDNLDIIKAICACMVITIHCPSIFMPEYVEATTRIAVPVFFIISGYFYVNNPSFKSTLKKIGRTLTLLIITNFGYACMYIIGGQSFKVKEEIGNGIVNILLGDFLMWLPGWFLLALAYTYMLGYIIEKTGLRSSVLLVITLLIIICQLFLQYNPGIAEMIRHMAGIRGIFVTKGLAFFFSGMLINRHEELLGRISVKKYVFAALLLQMFVLIEKYVEIHGSNAGGYNLYLCTPFLAVTVFCMGLFCKTWNAPFLKFAGRNLSMYMYCVHIAVMSVLSRLGLNYESLWLCLVSICCSYVIYKCVDALTCRIRHIKE